MAGSKVPKGSTKVAVAPQHATFELGTRPAALRNPRVGTNSGISIKPQQGVSQYGKMPPIGFGNTGNTGES